MLALTSSTLHVKLLGTRQMTHLKLHLQEKLARSTGRQINQLLIKMRNHVTAQQLQIAIKFEYSCSWLTLPSISLAPLLPSASFAYYQISPSIVSRARHAPAETKQIKAAGTRLTIITSRSYTIHNSYRKFHCSQIPLETVNKKVSTDAITKNCCQLSGCNLNSVLFYTGVVFRVRQRLK